MNYKTLLIDISFVFITAILVSILFNKKGILVEKEAASSKPQNLLLHLDNNIRQTAQKQFLKLVLIALAMLGAIGVFLFFRGGENKKPLNETQTSINSSSSVIVINNHGGNMEGHTPRGFQDRRLKISAN